MEWNVLSSSLVAAGTWGGEFASRGLVDVFFGSRLFGCLLLWDPSLYKPILNKSSCKLSRSRGQVNYSHPISTINLSFPENRVVPPVRPAPTPSTWLVGMERKAWLSLSNGAFQGSGSSTFTPHGRICASCLQPPLKCCCCYTTVMNSGMSLVIYCVT